MIAELSLRFSFLHVMHSRMVRNTVHTYSIPPSRITLQSTRFTNTEYNYNRDTHLSAILILPRDSIRLGH